ncbi:MAG: TetR/AcrR family transcriptional regulator [Pseudomonadota bacterium]
MARPRSYDSETLALRTLTAFWQGGYHATSMDDLVRATGVSRHGIYKEFGGKKDMFLSSFELYQKLVVSPAFEQVEQKDATLEDIAAYFERQISLAEENGLPGPGCLVANSATEVAPHDADVARKVDAHSTRLRRGFASAIRNSADGISPRRSRQLAETMLVFATGLWAMSRVTSDARDLRRAVTTFLDMVEGELK